MERHPMEMALSTDIVLDLIMSHLKVRDLLACRQVSKFWNKAASSVTRRRLTMMRLNNTQTLTKIQNRMNQNSEFPFSGLECTTTAAAMKLVENHGGRLIRLRLDTRWTIRPQDLAPFISHLPRLSILELRLSPALHPPRGNPAYSQVLDLSSLRIIRLSPSFPEQNEDVVESNKDLLRQVFKAASSPQLRIECLDVTYEILSALENAGKLQAVSVINVSKVKKLNDDILRVDHWLSTQRPTLTKLDLKDGGCISREGLMTLLISSQETLKYLRLQGICPSDFLSDECPVLSKLTTLNLEIDRACEYVFQGEQGHKFPELQELILGISGDPSIVNMSDGLFIVESLKMIDLYGWKVNKAGIEDLARSFPNVIEVRLEQLDSGRWWYCDHTDIWSVGAFKLLEKLRIWDYPVQPPTKIFKNYKQSQGSMNLDQFKMMNMDSLLTGIPISVCENLRKQPQQNLQQDSRTRTLLKGCPFNESLRESPSLLQLENLKELIVCVKLEETLKPLPKEPPFISMVSVQYALQMMPKLTAKFLYDYSSPSEDFKEKHRDKAVKKLKTAFKHVQPHVELEPFFY